MSEQEAVDLLHEFILSKARPLGVASAWGEVLKMLSELVERRSYVTPYVPVYGEPCYPSWEVISQND